LATSPKTRPPPSPAPPPPPPPPPPPTNSPAEEFVAQLKAIIADRGAIGLTARARKKLLSQAAERFQLAPVYAGHLIDNVLQQRMDAAAKIKATRNGDRWKTDDADSGAAAENANRDAEQATGDPLVEFHRRATLVVAEQRGLNTQSRLRLEVVGRELGITGEAFEEALARLTGSKEDAKDRAEMQALERQVAFQTYAEEQLARVNAALMTQSMHNKLVEAAMRRFGVDFEEAGRITIAAATSRGMRFISTEKALRHVDRLYVEVSAGQTRITPAARRRLHAEGRQWGLSVDQVDDLIRSRQSGLRQSSARRRKLIGLALAGCGAVAVAALLILGYWVTLGQVPDGVASETEGPDEAERASDAREGDATGPTDDGDKTKMGGGTTRRPLVATWWDTRLTGDIVKAKVVLPTARSALEQLVEEDAAARADAYEELVAAAARLDERDRRRSALESLLAAAHALEPSDDAAARLRMAIMKIVPEASDEAPRDPSEFSNAYWAIRLLTAISNHEDTPETRRKATLALLSAQLGVTLSEDMPAAERFDACMAGLTERLFETVIAAAADQPFGVRPLYEFLIAEAELLIGRRNRHFDRARLQCLESEYLAAVIPKIGDDWTQYRDALMLVIGSRDKLNVLRLVDIFESSSNKSLKEFLFLPLLARSGYTGEPLEDFSQLPAIVRKNLGAVDPERPRDPRVRYRQLTEAWEATRVEFVASPSPEQALKQAERCNRVATLAVAVTHGELGSPVFAEWFERLDEPTAIDREAVDEPAGPPRGARFGDDVSERLQRQVDDYIRPLASPRVQDFQKLQNIRNLANAAKHLPDLRPDQARTLAAYLLAGKSVLEHQALMRAGVEQLLRFTQVRLAMADAVADAALRPEHVRELVETALGEEIGLADDAMFRREARRRLLLDVIARLGGVVSTAAPSGRDPPAEGIAAGYGQQMKLWGAAPGVAREATSPQEAFRWLLENQSAASKDDIAARAAAADALASTGMQQAVLLGDGWLEEVARRATQIQPSQRGEIETLVFQTREKIAAAEDAATQIYLLERTLTELWLIIAEPKE